MSMSSFVFKEPTRRIQENYVRIDHQLKQLENSMQMTYEQEKTRYVNLLAKLDAYSPLKTLARGYTITKKGDTVMKTKEALVTGDMVDIRFVDGSVKAQIQ